MKKINIFFLMLVVSFNLQSQIFTVSSGTDLFIAANTIFSADKLTLTPSSNLTLTNVSLTNNSTVTNSTSATYAARVYKFSSTTNAFSGTIQVNYLDAELSGLTESTLQANVHNGTQWMPYTSATNDVSGNIVLSNSISSVALNEIALGGSATPLPVELIHFTAVTRNGTIVLNWATATESANYGFDIERENIINRQGQETIHDWQKIGFVKGSGTSTSQKQYSFVDAGVRKGKYNYRLKQIDRDGKFNYYTGKIISIGVDLNKIVIDGNYQNPFNGREI